MALQEQVPSYTWRWLGVSAVLVLVAAVALIGFISAGRFDPKPMGRLQEDLSLGPRQLGAGQTDLFWPLDSGTGLPSTLRLTAALAEGEMDTGYGLALGSEPNYVLVAVSPTGYVTIQRVQQNDGQPAPVEPMPWQTWPHVRSGRQGNEIWVNVDQGALTEVRINRELLWQGALPLSGRQAGVWAQSFGGPATVDFSRLELFAPQGDPQQVE